MGNQTLQQISYQTQLLALNALIEAARGNRPEVVQVIDSIDILAQSLRSRSDCIVIDLDRMDDLERCYQAVIRSSDC